MMRSQLVFEASRVIPSRFLLAALLSKGVRVFHRPNTRLAERVNRVLGEIAALQGISGCSVAAYTDKFAAEHKAKHAGKVL